MSANNEQRYYDALKRIANYLTPEKLHKNAEKLYGLSGEEAIEMAYDNVLAEAKAEIKGKRRPTASPSPQDSAEEPR